MAPTKVNYKIYQGSTFNETLRWESPTKVYVPITSIFRTAPMTITAAGHNMLVGWRGKISNVVGMTEANNLDYIVASSITTDTVTFNSVNAVGFKDYVSGGILEYNQPVSLSGYTARMQIRAKINDATVIDELTTENGGIIINDSTKTITILISAADTAAYTFKSAVYSLEMVNGTSVTPLIYGTLSLDSEVTR